MKHACLISYSHHTFKNPKMVIIWVNKEKKQYIQEFFDEAREIIAKLEELPKEEIHILTNEYLGGSVDTIISYGFRDAYVFKAHPGDIMYEVTDDLPIPIHWKIESVEIRHEKVLYKLKNDRIDKFKYIESSLVNTDKGFYTRRDQAFKICEDRRKS